MSNNNLTPPPTRVGSLVRSLIELTNAFTPLIAAVAAVLGAWATVQSLYNTKRGDQAASGLQQLAQQHGANVNHTVSAGANSLVVQIASYLPINCATAQAEIEGYQGKFEVEPRLWQQPASAFIIVGIPAQSAEQAASLKQKAIALSPSFPQNDLKDAFIRSSASWRQLASCDEVK